ncbi:hypothetical protein P3T97_14045 (plasmid) [Mammaliicoccus sciuri]|uniref:hypothetical protein n=1 Tax=Mammaliicoccus sciuri TaxID=1296 RepID=UPI0023B1AAFA|nr:hypothetical protein [Mammaliicoccus sciuri]MDE9962298.1 hypothetical protein [Staphylococcus pseudintermedius]WQJ67287.1 hypothetical protein P3T97_14045 [Mammaliicoccus sciuri]
MNEINQYKKTKAKIEKLNLQKNRLKNIDRKKRANRLIQKGALLEKYLEAEKLSPEETEELLKVFANYINSNKPNKFKKE